MEETDPVRWCVVANVAAFTTHGPGGQDVQVGLKHFSSGTKLWLVAPFWGTGADRIEVLGRHRGARGLVRMVVERKHLTNFRVRGVYSPAVLREMGHDNWPDKAEAEAVAQRWNRLDDALGGVLDRGRRMELFQRLSAIVDANPTESTVSMWFDWMLRDDVLADPTSTIGHILRDQAEARAVGNLLELVRSIREHGTGYQGHRTWPWVVAAAQRVVDLLAVPMSSQP